MSGCAACLRARSSAASAAVSLPLSIRRSASASAMDEGVKGQAIKKRPEVRAFHCGQKIRPKQMRLDASARWNGLIFFIAAVGVKTDAQIGHHCSRGSLAGDRAAAIEKFGDDHAGDGVIFKPRA